MVKWHSAALLNLMFQNHRYPLVFNHRITLRFSSSDLPAGSIHLDLPLHLYTLNLYHLPSKSTSQISITNRRYGKLQGSGMEAEILLGIDICWRDGKDIMFLAGDFKIGYILTTMYLFAAAIVSNS